MVSVEAVSYSHLRAHETDSYLVCRLLLEKDLSHSQEVMGNVANILKTTLIFSKPGKLIAVIAEEILEGGNDDIVDSTLFGHFSLFSTQYFSHKHNSASIAFGFGRSSS